VAPYLRHAMPNYARRQQYRRLVHAGETTLGSVIAALLGLAILSAGAAALAGLVLVTAVGLGLYARHWLSLASRSRVGARSENEVQRVLAPLRAEGWRLRHSLPWQGQGDIDSVAIAPTGIAVAIETKTRSYDGRHLARVREQAGWLSRRRLRWARNGALAVMCLVRVRGVERVEHDVVVVSIDRLTHVLRVAAGMGPDARSAGSGSSQVTEAPAGSTLVVMAIISCPTCDARNRVAPIAQGVPRCPRCKSNLPWIVDADSATFSAETTASVPVVVDFWAAWCGPCRMISPVLEDLANSHAGHLKVVKVDVDANPGLAARFGAQSIPLLVVIRDGQELDRVVGALPRAALEQRLRPVLAA
jgi:thioredoxin 2